MATRNTGNRQKPHLRGQLKAGPPCLIDGFEKKKAIPRPEAMVFRTNDSVYSAEDGWGSVCDNKVGDGITRIFNSPYFGILTRVFRPYV